MSASFEAARAYGAAATHRTLRQQEADVFRRVNAGLRHVRAAGALPQARAIADNERLWIAVVDLMRDPSNALPPPLRASIISLGLFLQGEMRKPKPDIDFLVAMNDRIVAGLTGSGG